VLKNPTPRHFDGLRASKLGASSRGEYMNKIDKLYADIKSILLHARGKAFTAVNFIMVETYWQVGRRIVEEEQQGSKRAEYGQQLLEKLSLRLSKDFGKGFDPSNLWNMKGFYLAFPILDALRQELSWTHYRILLRINDEKERDYYLRECADARWSTRELERQIRSLYYHRIGGNRKRLLLSKHGSRPRENTPSGYIKDPFVFEFLGLSDAGKLKESRLEQALIDHLQKFLLELGKGFSFVARQKRISTETQDFYVDLIFYNYLLKCFVLIDLKTNKLTHQDIGQMDMYVRLVNSKIKAKGDNPAIGIILCADKDETIVRYSVMKDNKKLFASKYKLYLPTKRELTEEIEREKLMH
jgi:predicted nuclease of restriction endonuclease-like (RecB) superfamily